MSSVEQRIGQIADDLSGAMDASVREAVAELRQIAAALREQPEARGVVDAVAWHVIHDDGGSHVMLAETVDDTFRAALAANGRRVRPLIYGDTRTAAQQPEDLKAWSLRMAEKEQDQHVSAGSHGIEDVPVQEGGGELPGMWSASDFTGSDPEERAQHRAMRTAPPSAPVGGDDTARMDWLERHDVEVREPLLYGSRGMFHAQQISDDEEPYRNGLRAQIDTFLTQQPAQAAPGCTCPSGDGSLRWPCPTHPPGDDAAGGGS